MEGQRVEKNEGGGGKLPLIIAGAAVGVLAAAYLGVCAWAYGREVILPNVAVAGVDVSNLTVEQARNTVEAAAGQAGGDITLTLDYEGLERSFYDGGAVVDAAQSAQDAWNVGHGNFLTGGPRLLGHFLGISSQVPLALSSENSVLDDFVADMEQAVADATEENGYRLEDDRLVMTKRAPTAVIDWDQVLDDARRSLQEAFAERLSGEDGPVERTLTLSVSQSLEDEEPDFAAIHREVYTEPVDAALDLNSMEITDHVVGMDFDVQALRTAYRSARTGETFSVPLTVTQPKVTKEDLGERLFQDILGEGTTRVTGSANRINNVKLSAEACNNVILLPGEEFSYNNTTGSRTAAKGYKDAPTYQGGKSVDGIGGGICQTSSTIYYAVLHTTLEVVERHNHQFSTGYVDMGMDATVYYGSLDFRFQNSTDYPIKIVTECYDSKGNHYLNVKIYGTNPEGVYAVPESAVYDRVNPTTVYVEDSGVPRGTLVLDREQYACTGWSARTYRYIYDKDGSQLEKQDMGTSKYKMRPSSYHYNPADGDPSTWVNGKPVAAVPADPAPAEPENPTGPVTPEQPETPPPAEPAAPQPSDSGLEFIDPNAAAI